MLLQLSAVSTGAKEDTNDNMIVTDSLNQKLTYQEEGSLDSSSCTAFATLLQISAASTGAKEDIKGNKMNTGIQTQDI